MRQILMNSAGAVVARVPRPVVEAGTKLLLGFDDAEFANVLKKSS